MTTGEGDPIPGEWHQWRGTVDTTLTNISTQQGEAKTERKRIESKVDKNSDTLEKMPADIEQRMKRVINGESTSPNPGPGQPITFKYAFDKLWPVFITLGMLLLGYLLRGQF